MKTLTNPRHRGVFFAPFKTVLVLATLLVFVHACDESDEIGLDLVDTRAQLHTLDTLTIRAMTIVDDSVAMNFGATNILGIINDPVFGKTRASIYTQTRLPMNNFSLGEDPELDSIHLVLSYTGNYYGALQTPQYLRVYELAESFPEADTLFSNLFIPHDPQLLTRARDGHRFVPAPIDSVMVDSIMQPPQIRVPLNFWLGQKYIDANDTEAFENVPGYLESFKGLYLMPDISPDGTGSKYQLNMLTTLTSLELYYRYSGEDTIMSRMQRFPINEFSKRTTRIEHFGYEEANEALRAQILHQDEQMADSLLFLQSLGLHRANIFLPYVDQLADIPKLLINKAELIVPVATEFVEDQLPASRELLLLRIDEDGDLQFLEDYHVGINYFGGRLDENKMQYRFNVTKYFQQLLDGEHPNDGLALVVAGASEDMSRVVLHGPGRTEEPMRLVLYYSVFD